MSQVIKALTGKGSVKKELDDLIKLIGQLSIKIDDKNQNEIHNNLNEIIQKIDALDQADFEKPKQQKDTNKPPSDNSSSDGKEPKDTKQIKKNPEDN